MKAADYNGTLYAIQTMRQMLPASIYGPAQKREKFQLPCCRIEDHPRFAYRGCMLDVGRHFFSVEEIKRYLDVMSFYKLNRFHWHLTEDQGWRLPISKYPKLTEVGAWREGTQINRNPTLIEDKTYGGFYTKEEIAEVVAYADKLGIVVVPEVDLPGHMQAALASYPELGCKGSEPQPYKVWCIWGVSKQVLCVGRESTMKFLEDVLTEVCEMFPSEYIHIGGDECPKNEWSKDEECQALIEKLGLKDDENATKEDRLQNYVTSRIQNFLASKGRKIIGWDEILQGELSEGATVMSWRGTKGGIKAANAGYDVIMSPDNYCYINYQQSMYIDEEPIGQIRPSQPHRALPIGKVYGFEPLAGIPEECHKHILGVQANMWTEWIRTDDHLEYMLLPRLLAISEVQWCQPERKDYDRFLSDLEKHQFGIFDALGYNYRKLGHDTYPENKEK